MSRMRSSHLSYAPEKCRILAERSHPHKPVKQSGSKSTAPALRSRIVAVRHGFEDHALAGKHVFIARNNVAHRRTARALAHRENVLGHELVESVRIGAALAPVRRQRGDQLDATGLHREHVLLATGVEFDRYIRRRESHRYHDEQNDLAYTRLTICRLHPLSSRADWHRLRSKYYRKPSISAACFRVVAVIATPPSMRAISSMRDLWSSTATRLRAPPPSIPLDTDHCSPA